MAEKIEILVQNLLDEIPVDDLINHLSDETVDLLGELGYSLNPHDHHDTVWCGCCLNQDNHIRGPEALRHFNLHYKGDKNFPVVEWCRFSKKARLRGWDMREPAWDVTQREEDAGVVDVEGVMYEY